MPSKAESSCKNWEEVIMGGGKIKGFVCEVQRSKLLARRAETLLQRLRLRFPALPQTTLDVNKIQYNKVFMHFTIQALLYFLASV